MNRTIPYYTDARVPGALRPDAVGTIKDIVRNITHRRRPHKIGSQFVVQHDPTLMGEVAPTNFVSTLFGNHFTADHLLGHGHSFFGLFPGLTTVPVFVAGTNSANVGESKQNADDAGQSCDATAANFHVRDEPSSIYGHPVTGLHCEPIANLAVQLAGYRAWTLVDPQHSWIIRPAMSEDGRSFFPSWLPSDRLPTIPRYEVVTGPGDAVFVPTWTWHRVDYLVTRSDAEDDDLGMGLTSIGASLFHFRPRDYLRRNPLFAILLFPAIIGEAIGTSSQ